MKIVWILARIGISAAYTVLIFIIGMKVLNLQFVTMLGISGFLYLVVGYFQISRGRVVMPFVANPDSTNEKTDSSSIRRASVMLPFVYKAEKSNEVTGSSTVRVEKRFWINLLWERGGLFNLIQGAVLLILIFVLYT